MSSDATEIAVVGSGACGMAAAFRLQQAGYRVHLLEANDYVGGRTHTERRDGFVIDQGATIVWSNYESVLGVVDDAGLAGEIVPGGTGFGFARAPDDISCLDTDHLLRDAARFPLSNRSRLTLLRLVFDALRLRRRLDYADLSGVVDFDVETAEAYGQRRLNEEILDLLVRPTVRGLVAAPASEVSNIDLLFSVVRFMGIGTEWLAFREGMGSYAQMVSSRFDVTLGARVTGVEEIGSEVSLTWEDAEQGERTERFAGCVLAVPAPAAAALHPRLDRWRRRFLEQTRYSAMQTVSLALSRPPKDIPASLLVVPESADIFVSIFEHNKAPGRVPAGKGLVNLYTPDALARELLEEDDDVVVARAIEAAEAVLPRMSDEIEFTVVRHWETAILHTRIGHYRDLVRFREIREQDDRLIQIAGDYFAPSSMNTASASGERAASDLVAALQRPRRTDGAQRADPERVALPG